MADTTDLLNQACEIRDADQDQENTAMRVGTMFVDIIRYIGTFITSNELSDALETALSYFAQLNSSKTTLDWRQSPIVLLETMGAALDDVDGGTRGYSPVTGDLYYDNHGGYQIFIKNATGATGYPARTGVIYVNKHTLRMYEWNGTSMAEIGRNSHKSQVIDIMPITDLNAMSVGEVGYNPSTHKLTVKLGNQSWWSWTPDPKLVYCDASTNTNMRWDATNNEWVSTGGGANDPINSLESTSADKPLSAAQGYVLRRELEKVLAALSNSAFSTARPVLSWSAPVTYSLTQNLLHVTSSHSGNTVDGNGGAVTIVLTPASNYLLRAADVTVVMAGGGTATVERDTSTGAVTVSITTVTGSITITATAHAIQQKTISYSLSNCQSSNEAVSVNEGSRFTTVLSASCGYTLNGVNPTTTMGGTTVNGAWNAATRTITIEDVTGDIVISATAVVTQNKSVTYNLSGCTKSSGPAEVEDGGSLTAVLSKGNDFNGVYNTPSSGQGKNYYFSRRDVIVMMGGHVVENAVSQVSLDGDVSISIGQVTGDVVITNIQWVIGVINYSTGAKGDSSRSICNASNPISLPSGCAELQIRHNYSSSGSWGIAFFGESGFISGVRLDSSPQEVEVPSGATYFKLSFYDFTGDNSANNAYIKDVTNNKYIWKGDNVE